MKILFFGKLAEAAGASRDLDTSELATVGDVTDLLCEDPSLDGLLRSRTVMTVLDDKVVPPETPLADARELAYLPPVSGG